MRVTFAITVQHSISWGIMPLGSCRFWEFLTSPWKMHLLETTLKKDMRNSDPWPLEYTVHRYVVETNLLTLETSAFYICHDGNSTFISLDNTKFLLLNISCVSHELIESCTNYSFHCDNLSDIIHVHYGSKIRKLQAPLYMVHLVSPWALELNLLLFAWVLIMVSVRETLCGVYTILVAGIS